MAVPYTFGTATAAIPLSQLDSNFATAITIGNTAVQLGNTVTTLNNMTLANVTISSGTITITNVAVTTANVSGTANISTLVVTANASVAGNVTVTGNTVVTGNVTSATHILTGGTVNGVVYLDSTKALTTGSALVFDGSNFGVGVTPNAWYSNYKAIQVVSGGLTLAGTSLVSEISTNAYRATGTGAYTYQTTGYATMYQSAVGEHRFWTAASGTAGNTITFTQAMTLNASGDLQVGVNAGSVTGTQQGFSISPSNGFSVASHAQGVASGTAYIYFNYNAGTIGSITQSGTTAVLFNVTSDQRLKENIVDADDAASLIDALQVRQFDWKTDQTHQRYGFIAQELVTVAPEAVHQPEDIEQMMAVDYSKLVPMLVKEIQSLRKRLAALESA